MKAFSIITVGCKVNQYESQQIRQFLEQLGWSQAERRSKVNWSWLIPVALPTQHPPKADNTFAGQGDLTPKPKWLSAAAFLLLTREN